MKKNCLTKETFLSNTNINFKIVIGILMCKGGEALFFSCSTQQTKSIIYIYTMFNSVGGISHSFKLIDVEHLPNPLDVGLLTLDLTDRQELQVRVAIPR